jgi:hypothetical protein
MGVLSVLQPRKGQKHVAPSYGKTRRYGEHVFSGIDLFCHQKYIFFTVLNKLLLIVLLYLEDQNIIIILLINTLYQPGP